MANYDLLAKILSIHHLLLLITKRFSCRCAGIGARVLGIGLVCGLLRRFVRMLWGLSGQLGSSREGMGLWRSVQVGFGILATISGICTRVSICA